MWLTSMTDSTSQGFEIELATIGKKRIEIARLKHAIEQATIYIQSLVPDIDFNQILAICHEYEKQQPEIDILSFERDKLMMMIELQTSELSFENIETIREKRDAQKDQVLSDVLGEVKFVEDLDEQQLTELKRIYRKLALILHPDINGNILSDEYINMLNEFKRSHNLTIMVKLEALISELEVVDRLSIDSVFKKVKGLNVENSSSSNGLSTQIIHLENELTALLRLKEHILSIRGKDLTIDLIVLKNETINEINKLNSEIKVLSNLLSELSKLAMQVQPESSTCNNIVVLDDESDNLFENSLDTPKTQAELSQRLQNLERFVIQLVEQGQIFTNELELVNDDTSPFENYRGIENPEFFNLEVYTSKSDSGYKIYEFTFSTDTDLEIDLGVIGDYWKFDHNSFLKLKPIRRTKFKFIIDTRNDQKCTGEMSLYDESNYIFNFDNKFDVSLSCYLVFVEELSKFKMFKQFLSPTTHPIHSTTINNSALTATSKSAASITLSINPTPSLKRLTRKKRMIEQAEKIAQYICSCANIDELILIGDLGEDDQSQKCRSIDMLIIGPDFKTTVRKLGHRDNLQTSVKDTFNLLDGESHPDLDYTCGDFQTLNTSFFTEPNYRGKIINNRNNRHYYAKALANCKKWDSNELRFVPISFEYFESQYGIEASDLAASSSPCDRKGMYAGQFQNVFEFTNNSKSKSPNQPKPNITLDMIFDLMSDNIKSDHEES